MSEPATSSSDRVEVLPADVNNDATKPKLDPVQAPPEESLSVKAANSFAWLLLGLVALQVGGFGMPAIAGDEARSSAPTGAGQPHERRRGLCAITGPQLAQQIADVCLDGAF